MRKKQTAEEPRPTPFDIGRNRTAEQFREANRLAVAHQSEPKNQGKVAEFFLRTAVAAQHLGTEDQEMLRQGALEAFHNNHPENIQALMLHPDEFAIKRGRVRLSCDGSERADDVRKNIIAALVEESDNPAAAIKLALENLGLPEKQAFLNGLLCTTISSATEAFIAALLNADADANASYPGGRKNGYVLAKAIHEDLRESIIKLLYDKGANFNDALACMTPKGWGQETIDRTKMYREKFTGEPADEQAAKIIALEKQVAYLLEQFNKHGLSVPEAPAAAARNASRRPLRVSHPKTV